MKWGVFFCKKVGLSPTKWNEIDAGLIFYFTFYLFGGRGVRTHPTHPPTYGPGFLLDKGRAAVARVAAAKCRSIVERRQCWWWTSDCVWARKAELRASECMVHGSDRRPMCNRRRAAEPSACSHVEEERRHIGGTLTPKHHPYITTGNDSVPKITINNEWI